MEIQVTVKPGAKQNKIITNENGMTVYLNERAHDNEANVGLIKALAKYYGVSKSCVTIVRGQKSRHKTVGIIGIDDAGGR